MDLDVTLEVCRCMVHFIGVGQSMSAWKSFVVEEAGSMQDDLRILLCNSCVTYRYLLRTHGGDRQSATSLITRIFSVP
jgi:hypothetical protein